MTIDEYIQLYGPRLYGLCLTLCRSEPEAEDLYQETWLRVVEQFHRYDPAREFEPWLTRICVNLYRNLLRRLVRSPIRQSFFPRRRRKHFSIARRLLRFRHGRTMRSCTVPLPACRKNSVLP